MKDDVIEKYIANGDISILDNMSQVEKKEYKFIGKYINSSNLDTRDALLSFLEEINQPWCYRWYSVALKDAHPTIRVLAARGIMKLKPAGKANELINNIKEELNNFPREDNLNIPYLIKAIGNIGSKKDIKPLKDLLNEIYLDSGFIRYADQLKEVQEAGLAALAKLNDDEAIRRIEERLSMGTSTEKMEALEIVEYTEQKRWIPYVVPLLLDESEAMSFEITVKVVKRVCDFAANTLLAIDKEKKLDIEPLGLFPYTAAQMERVRALYGLSKTKDK